MELKQIFNKVRHNFNNSAEAWNKGLTIFTTDKDNITYQWEITNIVFQDEVHLQLYIVIIVPSVCWY